MNDKHGLRVAVDLGQDKPVTPELQDLVFDVCRELLFNVVKHAKTDSAHVEVVVQDGKLHLTVVDRGSGFAVEQTESPQQRDATGFGLGDIRTRVLAFGGELAIDRRRPARRTPGIAVAASDVALEFASTRTAVEPSGRSRLARRRLRSAPRPDSVRLRGCVPGLVRWLLIGYHDRAVPDFATR